MNQSVNLEGEPQRIVIPKTIYLAHTGKIMNKGKALQKKLEEKGYKVINPFDHDEWAKTVEGIWDKFPEKRIEVLAHLIIEKDLEKIDESDILVALVETPSIGTSMEIFYGSRTRQIPVFVLTKIEHPWLMEHGIVVETEEELLEELKNVSE